MDNPDQIQLWLLNKVKQLDSRIESLEANSPQGEYDATGCSGAGCTQRLEPAVRGPAQILAELKTFIQEEHESFDWLPTDSMYVVGARDAYDTVLQHIERLSGTEPQDAA